MSTGRLRCASIIVAVCAITTSAQQPAFRFERPIVTDGAGPRRLAIDVPLLVGAAPFRVVRAGDALRDLRLYDSRGAEVGYVLIGDPPAATTYTSAVMLPVASVDTPTVRTSGFEADLRDVLLIDRFRIDGIEPPFLKRLKLEASGDRQRWTLLAAEATLFDLPAEKLVQTELRFPAGSYRYLRVTWDDAHSARIPRMPAAAAGQVPAGAPTPSLAALLVVERSPSEPGRSRFRVRLPAANLPVVALDLDVAGDHLLREASVFQSQLSGTQLTPVLLGRATLRRFVRDGLTASALRVPIAAPSDSQIDLVVDDGDNPPLDLRGLSAVFAELPWIYLEAPGGALTARYGNASLPSPRYDLEAVRSQVRIQSVADAHWGEASPRSSDATGTPPPLPTVGAALDPGLFKYTRTIPAGSAGLVALSLDAGVLAHSAGAARGFPDLRVVDPADRQIPYIVEQASGPLSLDIAVERVTTLPAVLLPAKPGRSVYRVKYPVAGLPEATLVLTTAARVFDRNVSLVEEREADGQRRRDAGVEPLAAARWIRADQDKPAAPLVLTVRPLHGSELFVIVDEGDNSPLPLAAARLLLPGYRIRFFRDGEARLRLTYGRAELEPPRYDLALLAPQVLATPAADIVLDAEQATGASTTTAGIVSPRLFWGALAISVIVLLGLIARLLKKPAA
jgi:Protein of unknown function (DUF3999)